MRFHLSSHLPGPPDKVINQAQTPRLLEYVSHPIMSYKPVEPTRFPKVWEEGTYWVSMKLLGILPIGNQAIGVSYPPVEDAFVLRDNGHSAMIRAWDHTITISAVGSGTLYRDEVSISAGLFTPVVWLFALLFFSHRQRRWKKLVRREFDYGAPRD